MVRYGGCMVYRIWEPWHTSPHPCSCSHTVLCTQHSKLCTALYSVLSPPSPVLHCTLYSSQLTVEPHNAGGLVHCPNHWFHSAWKTQPPLHPPPPPAPPLLPPPADPPSIPPPPDSQTPHSAQPLSQCPAPLTPPPASPAFTTPASCRLLGVLLPLQVLAEPGLPRRHHPAPHPHLQHLITSATC